MEGVVGKPFLLILGEAFERLVVVAIGVSDLADLFEELLTISRHQLRDTVASGRMRQDNDLLEARVHNIVAPDMLAVVDHRLRVQHLDAIGRRLVRVHHQHRAAFLHGPADLRKHRAELEVLVDADAAGPDASADGAHALDDDETSFAGVGGLHRLIWPVELLAHEDRASGLGGAGTAHFSGAHLGRLYLQEAILAYHRALDEGDDAVADVVVLLCVLGEVEPVVREEVAADLRVHEVL